MSNSLAEEIREVPVLDIDPFSDEVLNNPYPFFELLRETAPVVYIKAHNYYAVGRYDEVVAVASDYKRFTSTAGIGLPDPRKPDTWRARSPITEVDPPEHTGVRAVLQRIMSPVVLRQWRAELEKEGEALAAQLVERGEFDGVHDLAEAFVLSVVPRLVGIDVPKENLIITGELNFNQQGPRNERLAAATSRAAPYLEWYSKALERENMLPGGFGEKIYQAEDAGELAKGTAALHVRSFFRAGVDTTIASIEFTLNQLARHPEQYEMIRQDPSKFKGAYEEALRFESPAQVIFRGTTADMVFSGYQLKGDTKIAYYPGAANRDPRKWTDPNVYDIGRKTLGVHVTFGHGAHTCIAQMIARLEAECILAPLIRMASKLELAGEAKYRLVNTLRTMDSLPLRVTKA
ncbi:cytochrome P450 [Paraburkholderia sp. LEh10]|uniref:cytochrome P450 n=1 Tax=Paraburkholderia sp. LEh10 TaxID=2821353 RepID=UPI001AE2546E|nr:cytochrome P450 [Paraburkholderia sp. LEh10]MBP0590469.1 cytochrome P450 [Paraburkholderia sp. LEh10]